MKLWKTIPANFKSHGHKWKINKWYRLDGKIELCRNGFHASPRIYDAYSYVTPGWICQVEVRGDHDDGGDKSCWREMRLLKRWKWTDEMAQWWAVYAAELVSPIYEKHYPGDSRVKDCIETTKRYLSGKATKEELAAARIAARAAAWDAARAAASAGAGAAGNAAARAAASVVSDPALAPASVAARYATRYAARAAAWDAARAAAWGDAAGDAARAATIEKLESDIKRLAGIEGE